MLNLKCTYPYHTRFQNVSWHENDENNNKQKADLSERTLNHQMSKIWMFLALGLPLHG